MGTYQWLENKRAKEIEGKSIRNIQENEGFTKSTNIYIYTSDTICLFFLEKSLKNGFLLYTKRPMFSCQKQSAETSFSFVNLTWKNLKRHLFTTAYCQRNKKISEMKRSSRQLETKTDKVATSPEDYLLYKWMNKTFILLKTGKFTWRNPWFPAFVKKKIGSGSRRSCYITKRLPQHSTCLNFLLRYHGALISVI